MPYETNSQLPKSVQDSLPDHAQDIYREAWNNAQKQYNEEDSAHRVAWAAVKNKYEKSNGKWRMKKD